MGSFVGNKHPKRWLWCAYDIRLKRVIAHVFGCRGVSTLRRLMDKRHEIGCSVTLYCTDAWRAYKKVLPQAIHIASKTYTQAIERVFLSLRTALKRLNRRTICFSRSIEIYDKVIGEWLTRNHYNYYESCPTFFICSGSDNPKRKRVNTSWNTEGGSPTEDMPRKVLTRSSDPTLLVGAWV